MEKLVAKFRKHHLNHTLATVQCLRLVGSRHGIPQERSPDLTLGQVGKEASHFAIRLIWGVPFVDIYNIDHHRLSCFLEAPPSTDPGYLGLGFKFSNLNNIEPHDS